MLNYWLGGARNFAEDRDHADTLSQVAPWLPSAARTAQTYHDDTLRSLLDSGVAQILDLSAGVPVADDPLAPLLHGREIRVVYVENEPVAVQTLRNVVDPSHPVVAADVTTTETLLNQLFEQRLLDPGPVLVQLTMSLHHLATFQIRHLLDALHRRLAPGSHLVITTLISDTLNASQRDALEDAYEAIPDLFLRTAATIRDLLARSGWQTHEEARHAGLFTAAATTFERDSVGRTRDGGPLSPQQTPSLPRPAAQDAARTRTDSTRRPGGCTR